jgi:hypothetical protein
LTYRLQVKARFAVTPGARPALSRLTEFSHREGKTMRKLCSAIVVGLLATSLAIAATAFAKGPKSPKQAVGSVSLVATPSTLGAVDAATTVTGNLKSNSGCRKDRIVRFAYSGSSGTAQLAPTAETGSNGDFSAVLPRPADAAPATVTLQVSVDQADRKVGSKKKGKKSKKGRKIVCLATSGQTTLTVVP